MVSPGLIDKRSTRPVLIWPNITIVVNTIFQEILPLIKLQHILRCKRKIAHKNVVTGNIQMQMICDIPVLFEKWNSHANFIHASHVTMNDIFLKY